MCNTVCTSVVSREWDGFTTRVFTILFPSDLRMNKIGHQESKCYSCNNRRFRCFREAAVIAVQVRVDLIDHAFLHGLITRTNGLSVVFFPPSVCKACGEEFCHPHKAAHKELSEKVELAVSSAQACWFLVWRRMLSLDT